jgi:cytochrome c556
MRQPIAIMILATALSLLWYPSTASAAQDDHPQQKGANPLIEEMMTLDRVFRDVVSAVSLRDNEGVHKALESMHGTMEKTHEGVHSGSVVIPRNATRVKEFIQMDRDFHEKLESLANAAHRNDQKNMLKLTKQLLDDCVRCHQMFRK